MHRKYDLFEKFPDGSSLWRGHVWGLEGARHHLCEFAKRSENCFYAMDIASGEIVHEILGGDGIKIHASGKINKQGKSAGA